jgi:hypothetical protein
MKPRIARINADWVGKSLSRSGGLQSAAKLGTPRQVAIELLNRCVVPDLSIIFGRIKPRPQITVTLENQAKSE